MNDEDRRLIQDGLRLAALRRKEYKISGAGRGERAPKPIQETLNKFKRNPTNPNLKSKGETMDIEYAISKLEKLYNQDKDIVPGVPEVTHTDHVLLECVKELRSRLTELESKIEDLLDTI